MMESKRFSKYNPKHIRFKFCDAFFKAIAIAINNNCFKQQFVEIIIRPKFVKLKKIFLEKLSPIKIYVAIMLEVLIIFHLLVGAILILFVLFWHGSKLI